MALSSEQLVGRTAELGVLDDALDQLEDGRFVVLQLVGEPGMGKTRLLAELGARAEARSHLVLAGSASELERDLPFWLFVDALDDYLHGLEPRRLEPLGSETLAQLGNVFPSLAEAASGDRVQRDERYRTHRGVRQLLELLSELKPLVLLFDDLHWSDSGSIELLGSLLRRPPSAPVLVAVALRPRQVPERLSASLERSIADGSAIGLDVGALTREEARDLLGELADSVYDESGGNPFYLQQLARVPHHGAVAAPHGADIALADVEIPPTVAAALMEELALLDPDSRRTLEGAAIAGDPFEPELAAAAADVSEADAVGALDELVRRDLVRQTDVPRRFRFRHPLVRGAVYAAAPAGHGPSQLSRAPSIVRIAPER
jgi:predicted ATPase